MEGIPVTLTAGDLQAIAANYNPALHEAPLTIGHPTHDAPAYGWVKSLSFADGALSAECEQSPELGALVASGHYKKVSASFYTPGAPGNPTPGKWGLRHVGFLGALAPGLKGLKAVSFADGEAGVVTFGELPGYAGSQIARMFASLREWLIGKEGQDVADRVLGSYEVEALRSLSQRADEMAEADDSTDTPTPVSPGGTAALSFAEPANASIVSQPAAAAAHQEKPPMKTAEQLQAELAASQAELQTLRAADLTRLATERASAATARHSAHVSFAEGMVAAAKWPASGKDVLVQTLDVLATPGETSGVVSFGEGDAARPLVAALQEQLKTFSASVSFGEFAKYSVASAKLTDRQVADRAAAYKNRRDAAGQSISLYAALDAVHAGRDQA